MDSQKVIKRDKNCVLPTYNRNPIVLEKATARMRKVRRGSPTWIFTSGIGVNTLGYCDLAWAEAVSKQAHKLQHASNLYYTAPCGKLAKRLCQRTGMSRVFFANSGAEANEGPSKPPANTALTTTAATVTRSSPWSTASMAAPWPP